MIVAPMPASPRGASTSTSSRMAPHSTLRAHGEGQADGVCVASGDTVPYKRTIKLPCAVDAKRANISYGNGVLSVTFPKAGVTSSGRVLVQRTGHTRGVAAGHRGSRGGDDDSTPRDPLLPPPRQRRARHGRRTMTPATDNGSRRRRPARPAPIWQRLHLRPDVVLTSPLTRAHSRRPSCSARRSGEVRPSTTGCRRGPRRRHRAARSPTRGRSTRDFVAASPTSGPSAT